MKDIHDVLQPVWPPNYELFFWVFLACFLILIIFLLKNFFKSKKKILQKEEIYSKENFLKDFYSLKKEAQKNFQEKFWYDLDEILKKFIHQYHDKTIFFLTFEEIKNRKKLKSLEKIFKEFDEHFYFYEKKWKQEFLELIKEIENKFS